MPLLPLLPLSKRRWLRSSTRFSSLKDLVGHHTAIDRQAGAGDPARGWRGEEDAGVGNIFGATQAPQGRGTLPAGHTVRPALLDSLTPDQPRRHGVNPDVVRAKLQRGSPREHQHAALRGVVVAVVWRGI